MLRRKLIGVLAASVGLGLLCLTHTGCGDDTRKDGTQVQISEQTKTQVNDMRDMYKDMGKQKKKD